MNPAGEPTQAQTTASASAPISTTTPSLPPEAIALATRFFTAARQGDAQSYALLSQALSRGGSGIANLTNDKGDSLVMLSSYHGHSDMTKLLLDHGADPNRLNDRGQSPLAGCVFKNEADCIRVLLDAGADPRIGQPSALECCVIFKHDEFLALFEEQVGKVESGPVAVNGHDHGNGNGNSNDVNGINGINNANGHV